MPKGALHGLYTALREAMAEYTYAKIAYHMVRDRMDDTAKAAARFERERAFARVDHAICKLVEYTDSPKARYLALIASYERDLCRLLARHAVDGAGQRYGQVLAGMAQAAEFARQGFTQHWRDAVAVRAKVQEQQAG